MSVSSSKVAEGVRDHRRKERARTWTVVLSSLGLGGALAMMVWVVTSTLPYLASSPTADPHFGALNACLLKTLAGPRGGFAVFQDGAKVAGYTGAALSVCSRGAPDPFSLPVGGVFSAAYDFQGTLWIATERKEEGEPQLWRLQDGKGTLERVGEFAPIALVGHRHGVAALDNLGHVVSLAPDGRSLGYAELPSAPLGPVHFTVDPTGEHVSLVVGGGLFVFRGRDLAPVLAESPCTVEFLWWLPEKANALLACGPDASWALRLNILTRQAEMVPNRSRVRSVHVPGGTLSVQSCENLPCTAADP